MTSPSGLLSEVVEAVYLMISAMPHHRFDWEIRTDQKPKELLSMNSKLHQHSIFHNDQFKPQKLAKSK
jgi:hypothetical protein